LDESRDRFHTPFYVTTSRGNGFEYFRAVFFTTERASGISTLSRFCKVLCLLTAQACYKQTDGQTDGRKSDLNTAAYYPT